MWARRHPAVRRRWLAALPLALAGAVAFWLLLVVGVFFEQPADVSVHARALAALKKARNTPRDTMRQLRASWRSLTTSPPPVVDRIPALSLSIAPQNLEKLRRKRDDAVQVYGVLISEPGDEVPGFLQVGGGEAVRVTVRVKGDWGDQMAGDRWSFRVIVEGGAAVLGMRRFSLHPNEARGGHGEALLLRQLREAGILAPRYAYVNVTLNRERLGVMALEEHFGVELLESQQRRDSVILALDEDGLWRQRLLNRLVGKSEVRGAGYLYQTHVDYPAFLPFRVFQSGRVWKSPVLRAHLRQAIGLLRGYVEGAIPSDRVFDMELMGRHQAIVNVWNGHHGLVDHNLRWYYNPVTRLLEPVAFDHDLSAEVLLEEPVQYYESWFVAPRASERFVRAWRAEIEALRAQLHSGELLARLRSWESELLEVIRVMDPTVQPYPLERLAVRADALAEQGIEPMAPRVVDARPAAQIEKGAELAVAANASWIEDESGAYLELQNVTPSPVRVTSVTARSRHGSRPVRLPPGGVVLPPGGGSAPRARIAVDHGPTDRKIDYRVRLRLESGQELVAEAGRSFPALREAPYYPGTTDELLAAFPFLQRRDDRLVVPAGEWRVDRDLIVPEHVPLVVEPGATLLFERDTRLVLRSPLRAVGTAERPIRLRPAHAGHPWAGLVVLRAGAPSELEHVAVEGTGPPRADDWLLTGGVTFYESDVRIAQCTFADNRCEDALNVIRCRVDATGTAFRRTTSDAIDLDFGAGSVADCSFEDIGGDAIDLSGTDLDVRDCRMTAIGDKAVSVGERSAFAGTRLVMRDVPIGVASKDASAATLSDSSIENATTAALMAYCKKVVYGPATLAASKTTVARCREVAVAQIGSSITIDGEPQPTREVDVDRLYAGAKQR